MLVYDSSGEGRMGVSTYGFFFRSTELIIVAAGRTSAEFREVDAAETAALAHSAKVAVVLLDFLLLVLINPLSSISSNSQH
jgi:hypothetical protein